MLAALRVHPGRRDPGLAAPRRRSLRGRSDAALRPHQGPRRRAADALGGGRRPGRGSRPRSSHATQRSCLRGRPPGCWSRHARTTTGCSVGPATLVADELLAGTAPVLAAIIAGMTDRQREIAHLSLIDGLRQSDIAERLRIARPTVSIAAARGDLRNLGRLAEAVRSIWTERRQPRPSREPRRGRAAAAPVEAPRPRAPRGVR